MVPAVFSALGDCALENSTNVSSRPTFELAETSVLIAGCVIFGLVLPFGLFFFRALPVGSTWAVLTGALLMVICQVLPQERVTAVVGRHDSVTVGAVLVGVSLVAQYVEREQVLVRAVRVLLKASLRFENYILRASLAAFLLSAVLTSDAALALLVPLLLRVWEAQERPRLELDTLLLALTTSANLGSVVSVLGSPQMVLIAARTAAPAYVNSRLDMRRCFMYLLPPAMLAFFLNYCLLLLHFHLRMCRKQRFQLVSEPSHSQQEMAGLTRENNNAKNTPTLLVNGAAGGVGAVSPPLADTFLDGVFLGPAAMFREELMSSACPLQTIPEDDILEIESLPTSDTLESPGNVRLCLRGGDQEDASSTSSDDSDEESGVRLRRSPNENLNNIEELSREFRPNALQLQSHGGRLGAPLGRTFSMSSARSRRDAPAHHGVCLSHHYGVYRSVGVLSVAEFLPPDAGLHQLSECPTTPDLMPGDSPTFTVLLCLVLPIALALLAAAGPYFQPDMGVVVLVATATVVISDALLNHRAAAVMVRRADWSVWLGLAAWCVFLDGLCATGVVGWVWARTSPPGVDLSHPASVALLGLLLLMGGNVLGGAPMVWLALEQIIPCGSQQSAVVYVAWVAAIAGNLTQFGSVANLVATQKARQALGYKPSFLSHLVYGFPSTLLLCTVGLVVIYSLLTINV